jgi:hypothetical protein
LLITSCNFAVQQHAQIISCQFHGRLPVLKIKIMDCVDFWVISDALFPSGRVRPHYCQSLVTANFVVVVAPAYEVSCLILASHFCQSLLTAQ